MTLTPQLEEGRAEQIKGALCSIQPGQAFVYHSGLLAKDRMPAKGILPEVDIIAQLAWQLMEAGAVVLAQRRRGDYEYDYIAVGRRLPREAAGCRSVGLR